MESTFRKPGVNREKKMAGPSCVVKNMDLPWSFASGCAQVFSSTGTYRLAIAMAIPSLSLVPKNRLNLQNRTSFQEKTARGQRALFFRIYK